MQLTFPNGEHAAVKVEQSQIGVGSAAGGGTSVVLPGLAPLHAVFAHGRRGSWLTVPAGQRVVLNARPVKRLAFLRPGDLICLGGVQVRIASEQAPEPPAERMPTARRAGSADAAAGSRAVLRGLNGRWFGRCVPLQQGRCIGRGATADLRIDDQADVLDRHAVLDFEDGQPVIRAAVSSALLRVNGHAVAAARLQPGDQIEIGEQRFALEGPGRASALPSTPVPAGVEHNLRNLPAASEASAASDAGGVYLLIAAAAALAAALTAFLVYAPRG